MVPSRLLWLRGTAALAEGPIGFAPDDLPKGLKARQRGQKKG